MLKLKLQYFGHLMRTADTLEKTLMLGKIEGKRLAQVSSQSSSISITQEPVKNQAQI